MAVSLYSISPQGRSVSGEGPQSLPRRQPPLFQAGSSSPRSDFSGSDSSRPKASSPKAFQPQTPQLQPRFTGMGRLYQALQKAGLFSSNQHPQQTPILLTDVIEEPVRPAQKFQIRCHGGQNPPQPLPLRAILEALDASSQEAGKTPVELLAASHQMEITPGHPVIIEDIDHATGGSQQIRAIMLKDPAGNKRLTWADFHNTPDHPLLNQLSKKFSFTRFRDRTEHKDIINFELPAIDDDNIQLTVYGMEYGEDHIQKTGKSLHIYLGDTFLVTTRRQPWTSLDKAFELLETKKHYKSPQEMMLFILGTVINRYGAVIDSLTLDFSKLAHKIEQQKPDDTVTDDALKIGQKIDRLFETATKQKLVLRELLHQNEFENSPLVPKQELEKLLRDLEHHLKVLDHYQDRKNGLVSLYQAQVSNDTAQASRRLTALGVILAPSMIISSLNGMNVPIPFQDKQSTFYSIIAISTALTGGLFAYLKKKHWL